MKTWVWLLLIMISAQLQAQKDWKLKKEIDGIKVYTRSMADSPWKEFKAMTELDASMDQVLNELLDAPKYTENCAPGISFLIGQQTENQYLFYARKELPWPIKDRDIITLLTVHKLTDNSIRLDIHGSPKSLPEKEKTIRVQQLMGHWLLEDLGETTRVTQQLYLDPAGSLPAAVVNGLIVKGPLKTFMDLQNKMMALQETPSPVTSPTIVGGI